MRNHSVTHRMDGAFYALADPTRRAVLDRLRAGSQPAGHIAMAFPVSRPAISRHLRVLLEANLVQERRSGRHRLYQLNAAPLESVDQWLANYRAFWETKLTSLKAFAEAGPASTESRHGITESRSTRISGRTSRPKTRTPRREDA